MWFFCRYTVIVAIVICAAVVLTAYLPFALSYKSKHSKVGQGHTWTFFYHRKVKLIIVKTSANVTNFSQYTMVNAHLVCRNDKGRRMKGTFTIIKWPKSSKFNTCLSELCLFSRKRHQRGAMVFKVFYLGWVCSIQLILYPLLHISLLYIKAKQKVANMV